MQIDAHYSIILPHTITHIAYPLEKLLNKHNSYNIFKKQLKIKNILYLDQLTTMDNSTLLKWEHLSPRIGYLPKGKIPTWFKYLENTLIENSVTRKLTQQPVLTSNNYFSYTTRHFSKKHKPWLITNNNNNSITIGKARLFNAQLNTISITHWIHNIDYTYIEYYPTPSLTCSPCSGCNLNSNRIKNQCTFDISATLSTQFWGRKISNNPNTLLKFNANYLDLIYATANRHPIHLPPTPNILIYNNPIFELFDSNSSSFELNTIATSNFNSTNLTFYTDGSVRNLMTNHCSMGIGWVQVENNIITNSFAAQIQYWPSSYKTELLAILSAISTAPRNCKIDIYTDSQSVIYKYQKLIQTTINPSHSYSYNCWPI